MRVTTALWGLCASPRSENSTPRQEVQGPPPRAAPYLPGVLPVLHAAGVLAWAGRASLAAAAGLGGSRRNAAGRGHGRRVMQEDALAAPPRPQVVVAGLGPRLQARLLGAPRLAGLAPLLGRQLGLVGAAGAPGAGRSQGRTWLPQPLLGPQQPGRRPLPHLDLALRVGVLELRACTWVREGLWTGAPGPPLPTQPLWPPGERPQPSPPAGDDITVGGFNLSRGRNLRPRGGGLPAACL